jgi:hypothetical protein
MNVTRTRRLVGIVAVTAVLVLAAHTTSVGAKELAGAKLPDTLEVGGKSLALNGLGLRKKAVFKVYVGALYLASPSKDAAAILAADQPKAIRMHFLRDLSKSQLVDAFREGFDANATDKAGQQTAFERMLALVPDVKESSTMTVAYVPGMGTTLAVDGQQLGAFDGKGFADAVFAIWLGPTPPSAELKSGMLGG